MALTDGEIKSSAPLMHLASSEAEPADDRYLRTKTLRQRSVALMRPVTAPDHRPLGPASVAATVAAER